MVFLDIVFAICGKFSFRTIPHTSGFGRHEVNVLNELTVSRRDVLETVEIQTISAVTPRDRVGFLSTSFWHWGDCIYDLYGCPFRGMGEHAVDGLSPVLLIFIQFCNFALYLFLFSFLYRLLFPVFPSRRFFDVPPAGLVRTRLAVLNLQLLVWDYLPAMGTLRCAYWDLLSYQRMVQGWGSLYASII